MKRVKSARFPFWMPELVAVPDGQPAAAADGTVSAAAPAEEGRWPASVDVRYFQSEVRLAFEYLDIARCCPDYEQECVSRALRCYVVLSGWVQANGGDSELEQHLQRLRWRIAALQDPEDS